LFKLDKVFDYFYWLLGTWNNNKNPDDNNETFHEG